MAHIPTPNYTTPNVTLATVHWEVLDCHALLHGVAQGPEPPPVQAAVTEGNEEQCLAQCVSQCAMYACSIQTMLSSGASGMETGTNPDEKTTNCNADEW